MLIEIAELQTTLYNFKLEILNLLDRATHNQVRQALEARIGVLDTILIWLSNTQKEREVNMEKLKLALADKLVSLDEIPARQRHSEIEEGIQEMIKELKPGKAIPVDHTKISFGNFYGRITKMKKAGKLPEGIVVRKRGKEFFLGKENGQFK